MQTLFKYGYATLVSLRSYNITTKEGKLLTILSCVLKKTEKFDELFVEFEKVLVAKRVERDASSKDKAQAQEIKVTEPKPQEEDSKNEEGSPCGDSNCKDVGSVTMTDQDLSGGRAVRSLSEESDKNSVGCSDNEKPEDKNEGSKWWLKGVNDEGQAQLEVEDEPEIYI